LFVFYGQQYTLHHLTIKLTNNNVTNKKVSVKMTVSVKSPITNEVKESLIERAAKGDVFARQCPSRLVLNHVTSQWGVLVLVALLTGTYRFSELRRKISGISERMLTQALQNLEKDGFVDRKEFSVAPPHVEYSLTEVGKEIAEKIDDLVGWIEANMHRIPSHKS
jgi:DNA-binding HxlR family transcriptional regulator